MNNSTFTSFQDNNFENDRNAKSIFAIANMSLTSINEYIAEAELDQTNALNAITSTITAFWLDMGRKFENMKKSLKPKEKFRDLVEAMGKTVTFVNKLIRATKVASNFPMTTAYMLGIDILAQLAQPKYADLIDDFINHPPENQLEASDRIKEFARSQPKKPKTPWVQRGSHLTVDGLSREYQAPIVSETAGLIIEQESENTGMPPRVFVEKAVQAFVEPKAMSEELEIVASVAEHHKEEAEELKAALNKLELEKTSTETTLAQVVETAIRLPINLIKSLLPLSLPVKSNPQESLVRELVPIGIRRKPESDTSFAIGDTVMYCGVIHSVEAEANEDGYVVCQAANGLSRYLSVRFLKKCSVS